MEESIYPCRKCETFKKDISELCNNCPIRIEIEHRIEPHIITLALGQKEILTDIQFKKHIKDEISFAQRAMQRVFIQELQNPNSNTFRRNRSLVYTWNKERIKALNIILEGKKNTELNLINPTHREHAIAYTYKVKARLKPELTRKQMRKMGKKGLEKAFDSINLKSNTYSATKEKELKMVIELLKDLPEVQKMAINDLDKLENLL